MKTHADKLATTSPPAPSIGPTGEVRPRGRQDTFGDEALDQLEGQLRRLAFNLHDGPMQSAAAAGLVLDRAAGRDEVESMRGEIVCARRLLDRSLAEMRRALSDLRPAALDQYSFEGQARELLATFEGRLASPVMLIVRGEEPALSPRSRVVALRILQEALRNVEQHAAAKRTGVEIGFEPEGVTLTVSDDGRGFDPLRIADEGRAQAFGILGMVERAELAGGDAWVLSSPGRGTTVEAWIPVEAR